MKFLSNSVSTHLRVDLHSSTQSSSTMRRRTTLQRIRSLPVFIVLFLSLSVHVALSANYIPTEKIFLNCGGNPESVDAEGRKWTSDIKSKFTGPDTTSKTSAPATQDPSVPEIPYMSARVFRSAFTYNFPVVAGRKFVRLHFYPSSYDNLTASNAVFSVSTADFTILKNFSVSQTADALNFAYIVKEYSVNVAGDSLNLTFTPSTSIPDSYAFVNGIEIVSVPDIYSSTDGTTMVVGTTTTFTIDNSTALENLYRLNVGGSDISSSEDTGLFRSWYDDSAYIYGAGFGVSASLPPNQTVKYPTTTPTYVAPADVYATARTMGPTGNINVNYNLTWIFSVDSGFTYLVRLHFCEVGPGVDKINQRVFTIFIGNQTAEQTADVVAWAGGEGVAMYKDYVVLVPDGGPQQDLWLGLTPNTATKPQWYDSILNGVEIFKISDSTGNLAGPNPIPAPKQQIQEQEQVHDQPHGPGPNKAGIAGGASVGIFVLILATLFLFIAWRRRKYGKLSGSSDWLPISLYGNSHTAMSGKTTTGSQTSTLPANLCRHFSFAEIKSATKNFNENLVIGVGGFGKVYRGEIDGGTKVAIKRGNPSSDQGVNEFQTEIELLSKLRHRHLVSLIGYCDDNAEMILVYDYMANGTLREHLYKTENPPLTWRQRLEIAIGGARGLHYLHTGAKYTIIHRDVKTTNILVDDKWVAKVSDFGLSKTGPTLDHTHVSTVVKGSFGYLDPEYFRRQQLTEKSDVYSFGVVLFEILCARPALNPSLAKEQVSLAEWGPHCYRKGMIDQIIDPLLKGRIAPECLKKFAETAVKCLSDQGIERPSMGDVLWNLEFALQLQDSSEVDGKGFADIGDVAFKGKKDTYDVTDSSISMSIGGQSVASEDSEGMGPSVVFSQIIDPKGR